MHTPSIGRGAPVLPVPGSWRGLVVRVAWVLVGSWSGPVLAQGPPQAPPAPVVVEAVIQRQLRLSETLVGTVMPLRRSTVGSQVADRVEEFLVNEGDYVTKGQPLAQLRTTTLQLQLNAAEAELALRRAELSELERSAPKEIEQARARMDSAQAQIDFNEKRLKRFQDLYRRQALSNDELEEQEYATEAARKTFAVAKSAWELASSGIWDAKIEQGKARLEIQQEMIDKLRDDIQQHTIVAPFEGYVTREYIEVGQWVTEGGSIVELVEVDEVDVEVYVLERYKPNLRLGAAARVVLEAIPGRDWPGTIVSIVPQADVRSRSFPVKVRLQNQGDPRPNEEGGMLFSPGMMARVSLPVGLEGMVTMVPKDAVVLSENRPPVVWVVTPDAANPGQGTAAPLPVELGVSYDDLIEVHGPLQPGQFVVVEGNERIRPGQALLLTQRSPPASSGPPRSAEKQPTGVSPGK